MQNLKNTVTVLKLRQNHSMYSEGSILMFLKEDKILFDITEHNWLELRVASGERFAFRSKCRTWFTLGIGVSAVILRNVILWQGWKYCFGANSVVKELWENCSISFRHKSIQLPHWLAFVHSVVMNRVVWSVCASNLLY